MATTLELAKKEELTKREEITKRELNLKREENPWRRCVFLETQLHSDSVLERVSSSFLTSPHFPR